MPDDCSKRGPQDAARVNIRESYEVEYWSKRFGVTPAKLKEAVQKVGPMAKDVQKYLGK